MIPSSQGVQDKVHFRLWMLYSLRQVFVANAVLPSLTRLYMPLGQMMKTYGCDAHCFLGYFEDISFLYIFRALACECVERPQPCVSYGNLLAFFFISSSCHGLSGDFWADNSVFALCSRFLFRMFFVSTCFFSGQCKPKHSSSDDQ